MLFMTNSVVRMMNESQSDSNVAQFLCMKIEREEKNSRENQTVDRQRIELCCRIEHRKRMRELNQRRESEKTRELV